MEDLVGVPPERARCTCPTSTRSDRASILGRIDEVLSTEVTQQSFSALEKELTAVFSPADEPDNGDVDSIANLALLDHRDNAALSNSVFEVKRRDIIRRDKAGSYIPACTRNVFLKYYTETRQPAAPLLERRRSAGLPRSHPEGGRALPSARRGWTRDRREPSDVVLRPRGR